MTNRNRAARPYETRSGYRDMAYPAPAPRGRVAGHVPVPHEHLEGEIARRIDEIRRIHADNHQMLDEITRLRQELPRVENELHFLSQSIPRVRADKELESRDLIQRGLTMEAELRNLEPLRMERVRLRNELRRSESLMDEMLEKVKEMSEELKDLRTEYHKKPVILAEIEERRKELSAVRENLDYEKNAGAELAEQVQVMEKNLVSMARQAEQLRAELERKSRPGPGLIGAYSEIYGTSYGSDAGPRASYERLYSDPYGRLPLP
ncbi:hypothetical protein LUZ60_003138 [Juncus effusus]|nr:hypothetical protein LUZ60_003138 [Juncus effusus]